MKQLFTYCLIISSSILFSQNNLNDIIDSINKQIELEDSSKLIAYVDSAINMQIRNKNLFALKGDILWERNKLLDNYDSIIYYYQKAIDLDSTDWRINYNLGLLYFMIAEEYKYEAYVCPDGPKQYQSLVNNYEKYLYLSHNQLCKVYEIDSIDSDLKILIQYVKDDIRKIENYNKSK